MIVLVILLTTIVALSSFYYSAYKKRFSYWKDRGVVQLNPEFLYGDTKQHLVREKSNGEVYDQLYYQFKKKGVEYGGIYMMNNPIWFLVSPRIVKHVLVKDFSNFSSHMPIYSKTLLLNNLFHQHGDEWRDMRRKLTPTFTSGKMKMMFDTLMNKAILMGEKVHSGDTLEIKKLLARYTTDVIGSCGFGIECNSLDSDDSEFFQKGQELFQRLTPKASPPWYTLLLRSFMSSKTRIRVNIDDIENFFRSIVNDTVKYREENQVVRKDFMHLMIQLKNNGSITDILNDKNVFEKTSDKEVLSMEDMAGQCMLFFTAGFETSSTTTSFALLELTQNQDIQDKLRQEVRDVLKKHGKFTYEAIQELTYCESIIYETLRKFPPLTHLMRFCTIPYKVPGTDLTIDKLTNVHIPIMSLQMDPEFFPEPHKFNPDRFSSTNKHKVIEGTYMPFGEGPRQCLGLRFGIMQSKAGLATLVNKNRFTLNSKTQYPPKFSPGSPILAVEGGIWLDVTEVQ